jgi:hypothetical protein
MPDVSAREEAPPQTRVQIFARRLVAGLEADASRASGFVEQSLAMDFHCCF